MPWSSRAVSLLPRRRDAAYAAGFFLVGWALYWLRAAWIPIDAAEDPAPQWARFVLLALICLAACWRGRVPLSALLAGLALTLVDVVLGVTFPVLLVLGELLHGVVLYGGRRASTVVLRASAGVVIALALLAVASTGDLRLGVLVLIVGTALFLTPVLWARDIRRQQDIAALERGRAHEVERLAERDRQAAISAERGRMATELHDVVANHLSAIALQSSAALSAARVEPGRLPDVLGSVRQDSLAALSEMRSMIGLLQDPDAGGGRPVSPRLTDVDALVTSARAGGLRLEDRRDELPPLPAEVELEAYRLVQEALANATRHAPGAWARLHIEHAGQQLCIELCNELTPGAHSRSDSGGLGLGTMRERVDALGGSLHAEGDGNRWLVCARIPASVPCEVRR